MATPNAALTDGDHASNISSTSKKLHGRAFYESLGSPKFVLAPMVDQSEFAWRMLTRSFMTPMMAKSVLAYSPMLHARMFTETAKFRDCHFQPIRSGLADNSGTIEQAIPYLDGHPSLDRPLFVQFCANNPDELLEAAEYVAPFCDAVDLNLGCPQGIARKGQYGAFLQEDQTLVHDLIKKLHEKLSVPVTAKIRILETKEKTLEYARNVLSAGASILTVHGRHRDQKGHKTGLADWTIIRYLRANLPNDTVLFANGNILRRSDIDSCLEQTGADAIMSAEGNLYDPAIFADPPAIGKEGREYWRGKDGRGGYRMDAVMRRYMDILYKYILEVPAPTRKPLFLPSDPPEQPTAEEAEEQAGEEDEQPPKKKRKTMKKEKTSSPNLLAMQPHLFRMLRPLVRKHHHVRDALAKSRAGDIAAFESVLQLVEKVVKDALTEYEATDGKSIEDDMEENERLPPSPPEVALAGNDEYESSVKTVKDCKRPWWICQPYVRPLPVEALRNGSLTLSKKEMAKLSDEEKKKILEPHRSEVAAMSEDVNLEGSIKTERIDGGTEKVEVPVGGLVCG
ncbi:MAG: hypothetical protein M1818_000409 [Claussenomyces sp. TS43310]|nr:MAG: hypothetical protein M1818_000409 [Claussenomyces sp. TS43310]